MNAKCLEICEDCGKTFIGGPDAFFCPDCRRARVSAAAKNANSTNSEMMRIRNNAQSSGRNRKDDEYEEKTGEAHNPLPLLCGA